MQLYENDETTRKSLLAKLSNAKQYLKARYSTHCQIDSSCASHCINHALSIKIHGDDCNVMHDKLCLDCENILDTFKIVKDCLNQKEESHEKKVQLYDYDFGIEKIKEWQRHIVRGVQQDKARAFVMNNLSSKDCMWIRDWAQKILPIRVSFLHNPGI